MLKLLWLRVDFTVTRSVTGFYLVCKVFCVYCLCRSIFLRLGCGSFRGFTLTLRPQQSLGVFFCYTDLALHVSRGRWRFSFTYLVLLPPPFDILALIRHVNQGESGARRTCTFGKAELRVYMFALVPHLCLKFDITPLFFYKI